VVVLKPIREWANSFPQMFPKEHSGDIYEMFPPEHFGKFYPNIFTALDIHRRSLGNICGYLFQILPANL